MHWIKEDGTFGLEDSLEPKTKWEQDIGLLVLTSMT